MQTYGECFIYFVKKNFLLLNMYFLPIVQQQQQKKTNNNKKTHTHFVITQKKPV